MRHYDEVEWKLYKKDILNEQMHREMEEHLFHCDDCRDIFLSLIDDEEIEKAGTFISNDFQENLMKNIQKIKYATIPIDRDKYKKKKKFYNEMLLYYTAVASVAIFLTGAGVFNSVVDKIPDISRTIEKEKVAIETNKINEFSKSVLNITSNFAEGFKFKNREEN